MKERLIMYLSEAAQGILLDELLNLEQLNICNENRLYISSILCKEKRIIRSYIKKGGRIFTIYTIEMSNNNV